MAKYRNKPVVIEAIQVNENFIGTKCSKEFWQAFEDGVISETEDKNILIIKTLEGNMIASKGDYIIKGVNGEFYPSKPDIFEKTYERVIDND